jgi:hypothetical protein
MTEGSIGPRLRCAVYNRPVEPADAAEHRFRLEGESSMIPVTPKLLRARRKVPWAAKPRPALSDDETKRRRLTAHIVQATQKAQRTN